MTNKYGQAVQEDLLTRKDGETAASAEPTYHVPESFTKCTVEVQVRGDGAGSVGHLCLIESKVGQGRGKNLPTDDLPASQVWS